MEKYRKVHESTPEDRKIGLNNTICDNPSYWCSLKQVWLTKEQAESKCYHKLSSNMIEEYICHSLKDVKSMPMYYRIDGDN